MRIGYEAKRIFFNMTGLGNYGRCIVKMMASFYPKNSYVLFTPKIIPGNRVDFIKKEKSITVVSPGIKVFTWMWRSKFVIRDLKKSEIEIYHGLSHELPLGIGKSGIKSVVTIHDLIVILFPKYFGYLNRKIYEAKTKYACAHADKIIAVSEKTKSDLVDRLKVNKDKIEVIYQNCDEMFKDQPSDIRKGEVKLKYNLPKRFILNIGTIEERKNLMLVVKALRLLKSDVVLVVIGKETEYANKVKRYAITNQLNKKVLFIPNASFSDLPAIYQMADVFVYPSRYEGFGIPVLEALVSGCPVIAATGSCLEEAGGPDSLYVGPDDDADLAQKLDIVLADKELRDTMSEKGKIFAQQFESENLAKQLMDLYKKVLSNA